MMTLEEISTRLKDRRVEMVADATGLHRNTVANIRDGKNTNPGYQIMCKLAAYFSE